MPDSQHSLIDLYEGGFRFNYSLQLVLICTFVLGGLGFPIVVNIKNYLKYRIATYFQKEKTAI